MEDLTYSFLLLFYPFCHEADLKIGMLPMLPSCPNKSEEPDMTDIINKNKTMVEPFSEVVDEAFLHGHQSVLVDARQVDIRKV